MGDRILTVREAAAALDLSRVQICRYCVSGTFPHAYKIRGTQWRIPVSDLVKLRPGGFDANVAKREATVERKFAKWCRTNGLLCVKFVDKSMRGAPDRVVMGPRALIVFLEFKSPSGRLTAHQTRYHSRLRMLGFAVSVCRTFEEAVAALRDE